MLGLSGQLGVGGLGNFRLASVRAGQPFTPHRGPTESTIEAPGVRSALAVLGSGGEFVPSGPRSTIGREGAHSSISGGGSGSEVSGG